MPPPSLASMELPFAPPHAGGIPFALDAQKCALGAALARFRAYQGKIVDGRNRYLACMAVDEAPRFQEWRGGTYAELVAFVVSLNLIRRHLSASQLALIGVRVEKEYEKAAKENLSYGGSITIKREQPLVKLPKAVIEPIHAQKEASKKVGVSEKYISDAKRIEREAPDLIPQIAAGEMSIPQAKRLCDVLTWLFDKFRQQNYNKHSLE